MKGKKLGLGLLYGALCLAPLAATAVMVGWFLPDTIPAHYGVSGQVDRWGSKYECFVLPGITLAFGALMLLAAWGASRSKKEDAQKGLKATLITGAVGLLTTDRTEKPDASHQKAVSVAAAFLAKQMEE